MITKNQIEVKTATEGGKSFVTQESQRALDRSAGEFAEGFGGDTDVSGGVNNTSLVNGFSKKPTKRPDDALYGCGCMAEHEGTGAEGFAERNNYYDRM